MLNGYNILGKSVCNMCVLISHHRTGYEVVYKHSVILKHDHVTTMTKDFRHVFMSAVDTLGI